MRIALVTGVSGQDGSYAAELLLGQGYRVIGTVRSIDRVRASPTPLLEQIELLQWNLLDQRELVRILSFYRPAEIYNFAAYSSGEGMYDHPLEIAEINGLSVARILEAIREVDCGIRFCQASSAEMFGAASDSPQSESTRFAPRSPYGAAKVYAHSMIDIYRQRYGVFACSAILFNHESPRRGLGFVTRKITHTAAKIKLGLAEDLALGNLEARRDWGFAGDVVRAMWMMLQEPQAGDCVVATGQTHSVREFCEAAFRHLGLDYRDYVREDPSFYRPLEPIQLVGDTRKLRSIGWSPQIDFFQLVKMMVDEDMGHLST
ncbi:MAG: GDP-mannose 4,6-dehydratase [Proteobacteria bacterium]|nr:GDP-mannose 4,6-dehydratase [Pseudomonadota bacterium]